MTNDFASSLAALLHPYAQRLLAEGSIAEQLACFNFNQLYSQIVIKVDLDQAMTELGYTSTARSP